MSFTVVTTFEVDPPITTTYMTTYLGEYVLASGTGTGTSTTTITTLWKTTIALTSKPVTATLMVSPNDFTTSTASFTTPSASDSTLATNLSTVATRSINSASSTTPLPSGTFVAKTASSSKTTAMVVGIMVPLGLIAVAVAILIVYKKNKKKTKARGVSTLTGKEIKHWFDNMDSEMGNSTVVTPAPGPPPQLPHPPSPVASPRSPVGVELAADHSIFRVASPLRPPRPRSIPESVINLMSLRSTHGTEHESIELANLGSPTSLSDNGSGILIPNTDSTPVYDGTRKKFLKTALEHKMPFEKLSRPSLRVPKDPKPHQHGLRRLSGIPEPLRVHKRSNTDANAAAARGQYVTNLEEHEAEYPSPVPTQEEFVAGVRQKLSKTPPLEAAGVNNVDLMADDSSVEGSFVQENEVKQKREESLAILEGRTPPIPSFAWGDEKSKAECRAAFAPRIHSSPVPTQTPIADEQMAARRQANVIDEDVVNKWL